MNSRFISLIWRSMATQEDPNENNMKDLFQPDVNCIKIVEELAVCCVRFLRCVKSIHKVRQS